MDLPLGKLVCDLSACENWGGGRTKEGFNARVTGHLHSSSVELIGRGSCSWRN